MAKTKTEEKEKTGYEGTGQQDTHGQVGGENDVSFPEPAKKDENVTKPDKKPVEKKPDEKKPDEKKLDEKKPDEKKPDEEKPKPVSFFDEDDDFEEDKLPFDEKKDEDKDEKPADDKKDGGEDPDKEDDDSDKDPLDVEELEKKLDEEAKVSEVAAKLDWTGIAKNELGIDLKANDQSEFLQAVKTKIDEASKKVEVDLTKYPEDAKQVIQFLENDGDINEILNPLAVIDKYVSDTTEEDVVIDYFTEYEGLTKKQAEEKVEELQDSDKFDDQYEKAKKMLLDFRSKRAKDLINASNDKINAKLAETEQKIESEKNEMIKVVDELKDFMGIKVNDKAKAYLKKEISSGKLTLSNNNAKTQVIARMFDLFGSQVIDSINKRIKDSSRDGYNTGKLTEQEKLHNIPKKHAGSSVQEQKALSMEDPLAGFRNIDKDAIEIDD